MKKTCLISGGTRGIGLAICKNLARQDYNIATFARTKEQVDTFSGKMAEFACESLALQGDASDDEFLKAMVRKTQERFGGIDVLINNAGGGKMDLVLDAKIEDWDQMLAVNLRAALVLTKLCLPEILKSKTPAIINIVSIAGKMGLAGSSVYCASKFGMMGFTQALFEEVRENGVKVCAICPGYVDTPLIPHRKSLVREEMISPEEIAKTVEYVLKTSTSACPVEIVVRPQKNPIRK